MTEKVSVGNRCARRKGRAKNGFLSLFVATVAIAAVPLIAVGETDVYGNEIKVVDGKTYQFWMSGTMAEVATFASSSPALSSSGSVCSGTRSKPSQQAISLEARFRTWFTSLGAALDATKLGFMLICW